MLSPLQERVARLALSSSPDSQLALAGGAALISMGLVDRPTIDLDLFTPRSDVEELATALVPVLERAGIDVRVDERSPSFVRLSVSRGEETCRVDIAQDHRLSPAEAGPLGLTLTVPELAADKMLALFSRAEPRDYVDVYVLARHFGTEELCELAVQKDPGFDTHVFGQMLGAIARLDRREFDVDDRMYGNLQRFFSDWRQQLVTPGAGA